VAGVGWGLIQFVSRVSISSGVLFGKLQAPLAWNTSSLEILRHNTTNTNIMKSIIHKILTVAFVAGIATSVSASPPGKGPVESTTYYKTPALMTLVTLSAAAQQYTCPMHPEVVKDAPGKCPKCGMKLVEKSAVKQDGKGCGSCCEKH
jgi:hypothetical protein